MVRSALIGMIFRHSLRLPVSEADGAAGAVSLMSADIERIQQTLQWVMNIVPNLIQVGLGLWILSLYMGVVTVAPLIVAIACGIVAGHVGKSIPPRQRSWMQVIQKRVGVTTEAVGSIKGVKMSGLTKIVADQIQGFRASEMDDQKAFRRLQITNITLGNTPAMLTPAITFVAFAIAQFVSGGGQLQMETAFTSLALLSILISPIAELLMATTNLASALSSLDRIQEFLQKQKQEDSRALRPNLTSRNEPSSGNGQGTTDLQPVGDRVLSYQLGSRSRSRNEGPLVRIAHGSFGWEPDKPILRDINLEVFPSALIMVIGSVGVGKSTLLRSLLGETHLLSGSVECASPKQIAYCDQEPWILNLSIQQNILGVSEYDEERYKSVVDACELRADFAQFPQGDETLTGSKGLSLSGGQRQRISLARAAYSGKQLIVMDDTFSGLDPDTSSKVFAALLGDSGFFRMDGKAAVFATHNAQWLPYADEILVLGSEGRVSARGDLGNLLTSCDYVKELQVAQKVTERTADPSSSSELVPRARASEEDSINQVSSSSDVVTRAAGTVGKTGDEGPLAGTELPALPKQVTSLRYYVNSMGRGAIWGYFALVLLQVGCSTAQPLWLRFWVATNQQNPNEDVGKWVGVYLLFGFGTIAFIAMGTGYLLLLLVPRSAKRIHRKLLDATFGAPLSFFVAKDTGAIVNFFTGDLNLIDLPLPISFILFSERLTSTIAEIILTCIASGYLAISVPFLAGILYILQRIYLRTSRQLRLLDLEFKAPLFSHFISTSEGLATIRAFCWTAAAERENIKLLDMSQRPHYLLFCLQRWLTLVLDLVTAGMATLLMGLAVALRDAIDPGYLGVALVSVMNFGHIVSALIIFWTNLETSLQAVGRVRDYVAGTPVEYYHAEGLDDDGDGDQQTLLQTNPEEEEGSIWPSKGEVVISNISASYGNARKVLEDINLTFAPGSKVAICGRTGSGKSSLLSLMLRLYEPDTGSILIDGVDVFSLPPDKVRAAVVALPQDPLFLDGSVRKNLDPFGTHTEDDEVLLGALQKTGLKEVIEEKGGLDAELKADWLSAGQRQLLCLARVFLRNSKVFLLDEATSRLDAQTEKVVNKLIKTEFKDWTVIVVTHRLKAVAERDLGFDQVVVLQRGRVIETGDPFELLSRKCGSVFREMVETQDS
ncbi:P-loop containing nucleoside triphosphate hydrolase protein [Podospora didyma]|uniref:P-loop containing nucleoside triphosphate hydrolase protein n=1 Tax=Podospora didyma TaxID=330526 RepID=A0AAE0NG69_9PEZI|nr:P-loop containing nucleoside triphosphate hydrolase protein [Podospora didyma]